jgi:uncharacterized protein
MTNQIIFPTGMLSLDALTAILKALPGELTYMDDKDILRFYTSHDTPVFSRNPEILGTDVRDCHPEKSYAAINEMIENFRSGKFNFAEGLIQNKGKTIFTKYMAIRNEKGDYIGLLEFSQDVGGIRTMKEDHQGLVYSL